MEVTLLHRKKHPVHVSPENPEYRVGKEPTPRSAQDRRAGPSTRRVADRPISLGMIPKRRWRYDRRKSDERRCTE